MTVLEAMAHMEGFFLSGSRPQRNNNPLDLEWGSEARAFGATAGDPRFAIFPDVVTGWDAGRRWLSVPAKFAKDAVAYENEPVPGRKLVGGYIGATIAEVINRFAPPNENNDPNYLNYVTGAAECQPSDTLTPELLG